MRVVFPTPPLLLNIAIDFMNKSGSWNSTLHNSRNFPPMDGDRGKK